MFESRDAIDRGDEFAPTVALRFQDFFAFRC
jgi:hypothetical protein